LIIISISVALDIVGAAKGDMAGDVFALVLILKGVLVAFLAYILMRVAPRAMERESILTWMTLLNFAVSTTLIVTDFRIMSRLFGQSGPGFGLNSSLMFLLYFYFQREMVFHGFEILVRASVIHMTILVGFGLPVHVVAGDPAAFFVEVVVLACVLWVLTVTSG
jgi:hypothetical protein